MKKIDGLLEGLTTHTFSEEAQPLAESLQAHVETGTNVELTLEESVYLGDKLEALREQIAVIEESVVLTEGSAGGFISWLKRVYAGKDESAIDDFKKDIKDAETAVDIEEVINTIEDFIEEVIKVQKNKFTWKTFAKYMVGGVGQVAAVASTIYQSNIKKQLSEYRGKLEGVLKDAQKKQKTLKK